MMWSIALATVLVAVYLIRSWLRSWRVGDYEDKHVFITGCDSGFGRALAVRLDGMGFHVHAGCLTQDGQIDLQRQCSARMKTLSLDVSKEESVQQAFNFVKGNIPEDKGLWAVVNNAGIAGHSGAADLLTKRDFIKALDVNLLGPVEISRTFIPLLKKSRGRLVTVTSIMGRIPLVAAPYCVSKFGLEAYMDVLRRELYTQGVKVSILEPGAFSTNIWGYDTEKSVDERLNKANKGGEYGVYSKKRVKMMRSMSQGLSSDLGQVVDAYVHAITAVFPKTRYVIGWDARLLFLPMTYFPDWLTDLLVNHYVKLKSK